MSEGEHKKKKSNHFGLDLIISIIICIVLFFLVWKFFDVEKTINYVYKLQQTAIGVWATIVGFVLTALSILVTVEKTKFLKQLIDSGHFENLLKVFIQMCYMGTIMLVASFVGAMVKLPDIYYCVETFIGVWSIKRLMSCFFIMERIVIELFPEKNDEE